MSYPSRVVYRQLPVSLASPPAAPGLGVGICPPAPQPAPSGPGFAGPTGSCCPAASAGWLSPPAPASVAAAAPPGPGGHGTSQTPAWSAASAFLPSPGVTPRTPEWDAVPGCRPHRLWGGWTGQVCMSSAAAPCELTSCIWKMHAETRRHLHEWWPGKAIKLRV